MPRRLFNVLSAVSLVLCVAVRVVWAAWGDEKKLRILATLENPQVTTNYYLRLFAVLMPYWVGVLLTLFLPLLWAVSQALNRIEMRRPDRNASGLCPRCGYDLRASPERCPECGTEEPASISN